MSQVAEVIRIAKGEVGYKEGFSGGHWDNKEKYAAEVPGMAWVSAGGYPWCATFTSWVALKANVASLFPRSASCSYGVDWFRKKGRFSEYPAIGAQVFFGPGGGSHTGLVVAYDATTITTVEGNTNTDGSPEGNGVYLRKRDRRSANTYGYGLPEYAEGITTADPSLKGKAGYHYAATASGPVTPAAPAKPAPAKPATSTVTVRAGQTLGAIAATAGITLAALLGLNPSFKAHPNDINVGDKVSVPVHAPAKPSPSKTSAKPSPKPTTKSTPKPSAKPSAKPSPKPSSTSSCK
jgi:LysM repeat protein